MNAFVVFASVLACACAAPQVSIQKVGYGPSTFVRAPAHDSASIESHRLGGNFAYSTAEAHAFARVTPEISVATHPVAETTHVHQPAPIARVQPAPVVNTHHAASPVFGEQAIFGTQSVHGPVRAHTTVEQQVYRQQHVAVEPARVHVAHHQTPVVAHTPIVAESPILAHVAPVAVAHAAPVAAPVEAFGYAHGFAGHPTGFAGHAAGFAGHAHGFAGHPAGFYAGQPAGFYGNGAHFAAAAPVALA